jgi:fermentation-respiration switch protein FrsA (DUF1100 family)
MPLQPDGLTFVQSDEVTRTPVRYKNRYGIEIAGDLYTPKDLDETVKHPALVITELDTGASVFFDHRTAAIAEQFNGLRQA